jgi:predicted transposase/invertase (TIGR01784 family)
MWANTINKHWATEWREEGREEGERKQARKIALRMLEKEISIAEIAELIDLTEEEVLKLIDDAIN